MLRFGKTKVAEKELNFMVQQRLKISDVNIDDIVISRLVETRNNFKYLTGYLDVS